LRASGAVPGYFPPPLTGLDIHDLRSIAMRRNICVSTLCLRFDVMSFPETAICFKPRMIPGRCHCWPAFAARPACAPGRLLQARKKPRHEIAP